MGYVELQVTTNFSFLRGASHPEEMVEYARKLGYGAVGVTDLNTLAGVVRAHVAAKEQGLRLIVGCRLELQDGPGLLAYPTDKLAYGRLSALLTLGNSRTEKGKCLLYREDVFQHGEGLRFIVLPPTKLNNAFEFDPAFRPMLEQYRAALGDRLYMAATRLYRGDDAKQLFRLQELSGQTGVPLVVTGDVHYHEPARRELQDIITCVREKCTIHNAGFRLYPNAERYLKPAAEIARLFRQYPEAVERSQEIAAACRFSLDDLTYEYPHEVSPNGRPPQEELVLLTWQGAEQRFGKTIPASIRATLEKELAFIGEMNYASYFLTVYDIVRFARERNILCQGRGSAANSAVCYALGITAVNPEKFDLLFERFLSSARNEPPDIDVDFEHERREEVIQYIYEKYGRDRAAIVATVTQLHTKGAVRDVGRAMGLSVDTVNRLSSTLSQYSDTPAGKALLASSGLNFSDPHLRKTVALTRQFVAFPRQLGQHTGGFIITEGKLTALCPVLNARMPGRTNIEWNKDDIEALGFLKVDVLALGMLTCIRKAFDLVHRHYGITLDLAGIPQDDPAVYEMVSRADTIGVFQIESRAQMSMLPRLKPRCFYDLVIEVAIVRPGPIQGNMVHPYLRRRSGEEPVSYPTKALESILGKTLGVPLFQEQAMRIAIEAGFSPAKADALRRNMATFRMNGKIAQFEQELVTGMVAKGYSVDYAQSIFRQLQGFGSYGFPESHAVSFALLVYVSSWLKCYYPEAFACALLNSMPMGFYQPAQIISDARKHGVEVRPVDVNHSDWDNTLEERSGKYLALRLGFRQVKGCRQADIEVLLAGRRDGFLTVSAVRDTGISAAALEKLADADAFRSLGLDRRRALWEISTRDHHKDLFKGLPAAEQGAEAGIELPEMSAAEHVVQDYASVSLSLKAHPVSFLRERLDSLQVTPLEALKNAVPGQVLKVAGLVLVRQRPGTSKGVVFMTLEDETGTANIVIFPTIHDRYRREILQSELILVEGKLQREGEVIHVIAATCVNASKLLRGLKGAGHPRASLLTLSRADEDTGAQLRLFGEGRNFR